MTGRSAFEHVDVQGSASRRAESVACGAHDTTGPERNTCDFECCLRNR